jgi:hypothetical protein
MTCPCVIDSNVLTSHADARCRCGAPGSIRRARPGDASDSLASAQTVWRATPPPAPPLTTSRSMGHRETWPISNRFRNWFRRLHRQKTRTEMTVDFFKQVIFWTKPTIFWTRLCASLHCERRQAPPITSDKKGRCRWRRIATSSMRRCIATSILRARRLVLGLGKVSTSGQ